MTLEILICYHVILICIGSEIPIILLTIVIVILILPQHPVTLIPVYLITGYQALFMLYGASD